MKEAIVSQGPKVTIVDSAIPEPGPEQLVIKVVVSGSNPKDWYVVPPSACLEVIMLSLRHYLYPVYKANLNTELSKLTQFN